MNIISIIEKFIKIYNEVFSNSFPLMELESKIRFAGDSFNVEMYEETINYLERTFKNSDYRKEHYYIKETTTKTLITSIGCIHVNSTVYYSKDTNERFVFLRELLNLVPYQRLTNEAEYQLIKYAMDDNMSSAARNALRNTVVSRSTVSKKIKKLNGSVDEVITKSTNQPDVLYIEMDEIHANLQVGGNKICPCAVVHEGHQESFTKRKQLKNTRHFASAELSYKELWNVIYDYVDKRYDIDKFKAIFVSGDGASGIKDYIDCFPNALFVLDKFHYYGKHLSYIFKREDLLKRYADEYLKSDNIKDFKTLVEVQIKKYPDQEDKMKKHMNYILNNLEGIKNQNHPLYKCPCSMEGHVSQQYARHITSSPYGFSKDGLNNKLKLLVCKANHYSLTIEDYFNLKYGKDNYKDINYNLEQILQIKYDQKLTSNHSSSYSINIANPIFDSLKDNNKYKELTSFRKDINII